MIHSLRHAAFVLLASLTGAAALLGCGRPFTPATPPGFVDLGDRYGENEYRATTAEGLVLAIRAFENDPEGDLAFWSRVVEKRLREGGGYALLGKSDVKSRNGLPGVQLRFGHDEGKEAHLYYLTVFVDDDHVFLHEAGGKKDLVERHQQQIDWSIRNFLPD
ncbi:serine/threonine protein kinase [Sorangium sp. So ce1036]|uniref:serine/threonine protein kinase n=1 Tax=Sorangium sp. So ce1036 TaxID=3133328 RepID=UPI003F0D9FB1